jgi:hypothetical protein
VEEVSENVARALEQLERRRQNRGLDDMAYMVASGVIRETADCETWEEFQQDFANAKVTAAAMVAQMYDVPHDFLRLHEHNRRRFLDVVNPYNLGLKVADEILREMKGWQ